MFDDEQADREPTEVGSTEGDPKAEPPAELTEAEIALTDPEPARGIPPLREVAEIRKPSTIGGILYLGVLATALAGIGIAASGAWRTGATWLAASMIAAAAARVVLTDDNAGMLRVRRKALDAVILTATGAAILFLAWSIPDQPR